MRLKSAVLHAKKKYSKKTSIKKEKTVATFLNSFKKGSKKFRSCFDANKTAESNILELRTVQTFSALVDTPMEDTDPVSFAIGMWNCSFLPNDYREFLFKERNNCLGLNSRVAHFQENTTDQCSFCRILNQDTNNRETFPHLFLDCPVIRTALNGFLRLSGSNIQGNDPNLKFCYWFGMYNNEHNKSLALVFSTFRFCIWKFRLRKRIPRSIELFEILDTLLQNIEKIKPKIGSAIKKLPPFSEFVTGAGLVDSPDPELHSSMSGSNFTTLGKKINQSKKNLKFLLLVTVPVLSLLSIWYRDNLIELLIQT